MDWFFLWIFIIAIGIGIYNNSFYPPAIRDLSRTTNSPSNNQLALNECLGMVDINFRKDISPLCAGISALSNQKANICTNNFLQTTDSLVRWLSFVKTTSAGQSFPLSVNIYQQSSAILAQRDQSINNCYIRYK